MIPTPVNTGSSKQLQFVLARWCDVLAYGATAGFLWFFVGQAIQRVTAPVTEFLGSQPLPVLRTTFAFLTFLVVYPFAHQRSGGFCGFRYIVLYPPLWVSVILAGMVNAALVEWAAQIVGISRPNGHPMFICVVVWVIATLVVVLGIDHGIWWCFRRSRAKHPDSTTREASANVLWDYESTRKWLADDREIDHPNQDRFKHDDVASRIARRLRHSPNAPTMALVGPYGSGKSSIARLVRHHLKADRKVRIVQLSLWPYASPEAAVRGILHDLVDEIAQHVGTLGIKGAPDEYIDAVERVAGSWSGIAKLLRQDHNPEAILQKVDRIATAAGFRIVLWVEDLDRFAGVRGHGDGDALEREVERLGPVRALLYLLDRLEAISVVVADTSLRSRFDIWKIARFVESPPRLSAEHVWSILDPFRSACLSGHPKQIIDPACKSKRDVFSPSETQAGSWRHFFRINPLQPGESEALAMLLDTPRALKTTLRLVDDVWQQLAGEIDFDDVLVMSTIRVARPDLFAFVDHNIGSLRTGAEKAPSRGTGEAAEKHPLRLELDRNLEREPTEELRYAVEGLLRFVFPKLPPVHEHRVDTYLEAPQGLAVDRHVSYWQKYVTGASPAPERSDQRALNSIAAWRSGVESDLIDRMMDDESAAQIETFVRQFTPDECLRLLRETVYEVAAQSADQWPSTEHPPGIIPIWRMALRCRPDSKKLLASLEDFFRKLVPIHLSLAHVIESFFAGSKTDLVRELLPEEATNKLVELKHELLRTSFPPGSSEKLLEAVKGGFPWTFYWFCKGRVRNGASDTVTLPFDGWEGFATTMLEAAEACPTVGVPLLVVFVTTGKHEMHSRQNGHGAPDSGTEFVAQFDEDAARRLFQFDRLAPILAENDVSYSEYEPLDRQINEARRACRAILG